MRDQEKLELNLLKKKLNQARRQQKDLSDPNQQPESLPGLGSSMALALRFAIELVAGLIVGGALGWFLDDWLGTKPWLMILFFILGFFAGMINIVKVLGGQSDGQDRK
ncbi:MAG: AtpZ/AtpI family protein [Alphaproteobacteria bacterium]|nr:AtpZ/AtpI family protein [Alphaproteobacteria bacterium]